MLTAAGWIGVELELLELACLFSASSVYAARVKIAEQLQLPVGAVRLVLPGGRPHLAVGGMELDELRTKWEQWPAGPKGKLK